MSVTGDSRPDGGGLEPVPAGNMPTTQQGQMPRSDAGAALSPEGAASGAGTSEGGDQPEGIDQFLQQARERGYYSKDDFNAATATLTRQKAQASQQATEYRTQHEQAHAWGEQLQNLLVEQGVDQEELDNLRLRFDADLQERRQSEQQEAQQFAQSVMQRETQKAVQIVHDAAYDDNGQQLFDPKHPEIAKAAQGYLQWVNYAAANQTDDNVANMESAARYFRSTIYRVLRQTLAAGGQNPADGPVAPQGPPGRGPQVAGARGGGGSASVKDVHANAMAAGQDAEAAFDEAMRAFYSS